MWPGPRALKALCVFRDGSRKPDSLAHRSPSMALLRPTAATDAWTGSFEHLSGQLLGLAPVSGEVRSVDTMGSGVKEGRVVTGQGRVLSFSQESPYSQRSGPGCPWTVLAEACTWSQLEGLLKQVPVPHVNQQLWRLPKTYNSKNPQASCCYLEHTGISVGSLYSLIPHTAWLPEGRCLLHTGLYRIL